MSALFSIHPIYIRKIFQLSKKVELRNRRIHSLSRGDRLWLYSTSPEKQLAGTAIVQHLIIDTPNAIWKKYRNELGLSINEFHAYTGFRAAVTAIKLTCVEQFERPLPLSEIRNRLPKFSPPQFYAKLDVASQLYNVLLEHAESNNALQPTASRLAARVG